jgi:hypothetical protein
MSIDIVVARYKEDISWMGYLGRRPNHRIIIFNDGEQLTDYISYKNMIIVEGDHKPCETTKYLSYIISNYDNLADRVVFTQARPFDHSPDFIGLLEHSDKWAEVQNLTFRGHPPPWVFSKELFEEVVSKDQHIANYRIFADPYLQDNLQGSLFEDYFIPIFNQQFKRNDIVPYLFNKFGIKEGTQRPKAFGACFSVTRNIIHKYPREFYIKLLEWIIAPTNDLYLDEKGNIKDNAIIMEYLWLPIFYGTPLDG